MADKVPETVRDAASWRRLKDVDARADGCSQWEADFLESCMQQLLEGRRLSARQHEIVDRIEEEKCP